MDDYPIPVDTTDDLDPVFRDILKALHVMGFRNGHIDVYLYSEQINREEAVVDFTLPEIKFLTLLCSSSFYFKLYIYIYCNRTCFSVVVCRRNLRRLFLQSAGYHLVYDS